MRVFKEIYLTGRFFTCLLLGVFALVMVYIIPPLWIWVTGALCVLGVMLLLELITLYQYKQGFEASRVVADKFSNGEDNPVRVVIRNGYPVGVRCRLIDEIPVEFQNRNISFHANVSSGEQQEIDYTLRPTKRGTYRFGNVRLYLPGCRSWKGVTLLIWNRKSLFIPRL